MENKLRVFSSTRIFFSFRLMADRVSISGLRTFIMRSQMNFQSTLLTKWPLANITDVGPFPRVCEMMLFENLPISELNALGNMANNCW